MQRSLSSVLRYFALAILIVLQTLAIAGQEQDWTAAVSQGIALREQGNLEKSISLLTSVSKEASSVQVRTMALGELGATQLQAHRYEQAEGNLRKAYALASPEERARYALYLGNLAAIRKNNDEARPYYQEALRLGVGDADIHFSAGLNLARLAPETERLPQLSALSIQLAKAAPGPHLCRLNLNLGEQARRLGGHGLQLAYNHLQQARQLAQSAPLRLQLETHDALAQLYEDQGRAEDALELNRQAIALAPPLESAGVADILISLEWRQGRLLKATGKAQQALAAYQRAVSQIEQVRQDIPIEYQDGTSSFKQTLEPILLGYADLLLQRTDRLAPEAQAVNLRQVIKAIELIKQTELQDFLGDRCAVEAIEGNSAGGIPAGTAVLYPVILADRVELLLETTGGIQRRTTRIDSAKLGAEASWLADSLRNGYLDYLKPAQQLHEWLLKPFADTFAARQIHSLIVVPDGVLRLVPMAVLHDGRQFVIEKHAVSMVTGMSMTNTAAKSGRESPSLVVGMAEPGPVVDKLSQATITQILRTDPVKQDASRGQLQKRSLRAIHFARTETPTATRAGARTSSEILREALALPGVKKEVLALGHILSGTSMLDSAFTVEKFRREAVTGDYRIVHIASHGVFGGSAETSYIMAYDDVLTLNGLQSLLSSEGLRKNPIDLLSLSACETASGDDRSPLGISGAAIKARARSVLGTLWPVDDDAARTMMERFYVVLGTPNSSKTEALRQAQLELIRSADFAQPFYWAPFVLIGNWL